MNELKNIKKLKNVEMLKNIKKLKPIKVFLIIGIYDRFSNYINDKVINLLIDTKFIDYLDLIKVDEMELTKEKNKYLSNSEYYYQYEYGLFKTIKIGDNNNILIDLDEYMAKLLYIFE